MQPLDEGVQPPVRGGLVVEPQRMSLSHEEEVERQLGAHTVEPAAVNARHFRPLRMVDARWARAKLDVAAAR